MRTPAPAEYPETRLPLRRGRSQTGPACLRAAQCAAPTVETDRERWFGKLRRRNETASKTDFANSGSLWARTKSRNATQILRAGNILPGPRGNPCNGGPGGVWYGGGRRRPNRRLHTPLGGSLVTFWPSRKSLAPQGETLQKTRQAPLGDPSPGGASLRLSVIQIVGLILGLAGELEAQLLIGALVRR